MTKVSVSVIYSAIIIILLLGQFFIPRDQQSQLGLPVSDPATVVIATLGEITKMMTTLNSAMLTAAAALAVKGREWNNQWSRFDSILIMFVFICGAISYFGGYVGYVALLAKLAPLLRGAPAASLASVNPHDTEIIWSVRLQYWGVVGGVILLGAVFTRMLEGRLCASDKY